MPEITPTDEVIEDAVATACRAPSLHNSQPWQWVLSRGELKLFLDPSRVMTTDQSAREALIGCGIALDHLRVAMAAAGWQADISRFPNPANPNHLATFEFTPMAYVSDRDQLRAQAIRTRHTDRLPFSAVTDWSSFEPIVASAGNRSSVHLEVLSEQMRPQLVEAAELAESLRLYNTVYHDELCWWTAPFENSEGIPYNALVSVAEGERVNIGRVFPASRRPERRLEIPEDHAKVLWISTDEYGRADALASGEVLSAVLLDCTVAGLATCPITHVTEVTVARELIQSYMDHDAIPQVLIRVGVVPANETTPPLTPRRKLSEVLRVQR
jgi:nitroreductase